MRQSGWKSGTNIQFAAVLVCSCAVLAGLELLFLPRPGLQADEVLFVVPYLHGAHFVAATIAAAIGGTRTRYIGVAVFGVILVSNAVLARNCFEAAQNNGFSVYWTNGSAELARSLKSQPMPVEFLDWRVQVPAMVESGDSLSVMAADAEPRSGVLYVTHCAGYVVDGESARRLSVRVAAAHLVPGENKTVADHQGNPVFCLFSLETGGQHEHVVAGGS
jgi:hypothetical protein